LNSHFTKGGNEEEKEGEKEGSREREREREKERERDSVISIYDYQPINKK
jgi:hypothetical protein